MKTRIVLGGVAAILLFALIAIVAVVSTLNGYARVSTKAAAVQADNKNVLDNTRKAIREAAAVSDREVDALMSIMVGYAEARGPNQGGGDGNAISIGMVTEAVPSIASVQTLAKLQNIVVAGRKDWQAAQTNLIELKRQGDEMLALFPSGAILGMFGREPIEITVVTSRETEGNFESGEDNGSWIGGGE